MKHTDDIRTFIRTLCQSQRFHALVIQSGPGWAKSTTVENALRELGATFHNLGSYTTALELYNTICAYPSATLVIDDCSGVFNQPITMALLKAATWSNTGSNGQRIVAWRSTSDRVRATSVNFKGKIVLLTNTVPCGPDVDAFLSRTLFLEVNFLPEEVEEMLLEAAGEKRFYEDTELARKVAAYLIKNFKSRDVTKLNLRTLQVAYELARINPETWPALLEKLIAKPGPHQVVKKLSASRMSVEAQASRFAAMTGLSRRTFFTYRRQLGLRKNERHSSSGPEEEVRAALCAREVGSAS